MTSVSSKFLMVPGANPTPRFKMLKHQICMEEVVVKSGTKNLEIGNLLNELMICANEKENDELFLDIHGVAFHPIQFPPEAKDFINRLAVETVETPHSTKGFSS